MLFCNRRAEKPSTQPLIPHRSQGDEATMKPPRNHREVTKEKKAHQPYRSLSHRTDTLSLSCPIPHAVAQSKPRRLELLHGAPHESATTIIDDTSVLRYIPAACDSSHRLPTHHASYLLPQQPRSSRIRSRQVALRPLKLAGIKGKGIGVGWLGGRERNGG